jgi:hypothetical protein
MIELLASLERDLADADRALKHAGDILGTPHDRLGVTFSEREIMRTYYTEAARTVIALQAYLRGVTAPKLGARAVCKMCGEPIEYIGPYWQHIGEMQPRHPALPKERE